MENRYLVGNAFLRNYYVKLNFSDDTIGFNGEYVDITRKPNDPIVPPKPFKPEANKGSPLVIILIIAGALLFVAIGVCIYIKKRNESINSGLAEGSKYQTIDN